jgi:hypothetical protein
MNDPSYIECAIISLAIFSAVIGMFLVVIGGIVLLVFSALSITWCLRGGRRTLFGCLGILGVLFIISNMVFLGHHYPEGPLSLVSPSLLAVIAVLGILYGRCTRWKFLAKLTSTDPW